MVRKLSSELSLRSDGVPAARRSARGGPPTNTACHWAPLASFLPLSAVARGSWGAHLALPAPWAVVLTASTTTSAHLLILGASCPQHLQLGAIRASRNNRVRSCHRCEPSPASLRPPPALRLLVPSLLIPSRSLPPPYPKDSCLSRCVIICFVFSPQYRVTTRLLRVFVCVG